VPPDSRPPSQEEILEAALAALTEEDIPPDDEACCWPDPDTGRPVELAGLDDEELDELLADPPPAGSARRGDPFGPAEPALRTGATGPTEPALRTEVSGPAEPALRTEVSVLSDPLSAAAAAEVPPAGCLTRDGSGGGAGFADGGVLDVLAAGLPLAGFAEDAHDALGQADDDALIGMIRAWRRLSSWATARELAAVAELARRRPAAGSSAGAGGGWPLNLSEFIPDEVAAALTLTGRAAQDEVNLALDLSGPLAATGAALAAGRIDLPKAKLIAAAVVTCTAAHAAAVQAAVLPGAPDMTTGQLRRALARAVLAADPDAADRQRAEALNEARVDCWPDPAGTANLAGRNLPAASVLAADKRLCQVAAGWKKHGAAGGMDLLRARAYLALLLGLDTSTPPADLLPAAARPAGPGRDDAAGPAGDGVPGRGPGQDDAPGTRTDSTHGDHTDPAPSTKTNSTPSDHTDAAPGTSTNSTHGDHTDPAPGTKTDSTPSDHTEAATDLQQHLPAGPACSGGGLPPLAGSVNLTIPLTTLLGMSQSPGEAAGYGPLDPGTARALACATAGHRASRWHIIVTGPGGRALAHGSARGPVGASGGEPGSGWSVNVTTEPVAAGECDHRNAEPGYRPSPALQRLIRARTTTCAAYGCGRPAATCDLDHTVPHDQGGLTCECNLAPLCRHHHRMKQAEGWTLEQVSPGVLAWLTPAGRRYITVPGQHPT
jgi:hypothetical protein